MARASVLLYLMMRPHSSRCNGGLYSSQSICTKYSITQKTRNKIKLEKLQARKVHNHRNADSLAQAHLVHKLVHQLGHLPFVRHHEALQNLQRRRHVR